MNTPEVTSAPDTAKLREFERGAIFRAMLEIPSPLKDQLAEALLMQFGIEIPAPATKAAISQP